MKKIVKKLYPDKLKFFLWRTIGEFKFHSSRLKRVLCYLKQREGKLIGTKSVDIVQGNAHQTCGYYDFNPVRNKKMLFAETDLKFTNATIKLYDIITKEIYSLSTAKAVNSQQCNRFRWYGDSVIYNDYVDGAYVSIELSTITNTKVMHNFPIYDNNENIAATVDFNRLGYMRPGYGYTNEPFNTYIDEKTTAITVFDLNDDRVIDNVSYERILQVYGKAVNIENCYINHICFSEEKMVFVFFFVEISEGTHHCNLFLYRKGQIICLEKELSASHYTWRNQDEILLTAYDKSMHCNYYLYNIITGNKKILLEESLDFDGHPTYIDKDRFVTDSYPDKAGYQHIFLVDTKKENIKEIVKIYSSAKHYGVNRCDLHPRYDSNDNLVIFDADTDGKRRIYLVNINE